VNLDELAAVIEREGEDIQGGDGAWEFSIDGVRMACLTDMHFGRMRLIAPIVHVEDLEEGQRDAMLEANFHTALDARYALSGGVVYSAFIHPLSPLSEDQLRSAMSQVATLVQSFGTSYTSGMLMFGPGNGGDRELN
jgi:hypothetical protein